MRSPNGDGREEMEMVLTEVVLKRELAGEAMVVVVVGDEKESLREWPTVRSLLKRDAIFSLERERERFAEAESVSRKRKLKRRGDNEQFNSSFPFFFKYILRIFSFLF